MVHGRSDSVTAIARPVPPFTTGGLPSALAAIRISSDLADHTDLTDLTDLTHLLKLLWCVTACACRQGLRSLAACEQLARVGYTGGLAWINGGLDTCRKEDLDTKDGIDVR